MRTKLGHSKGLHLSYASVAATVALVLSISGGAVAATSFVITSTKQIKPSVLHKLRGRTGPRGPQGPPGPNGTQGTPGSALAYAHVFSSGGVDSSNSKAIASGNVSHPGTGIYCISGLSFTPHNAVATVDFNTGGGDPSITATLGVGGGSGCPAGTQVTVGTGDGAPLANRAFYVALN